MVTTAHQHHLHAAAGKKGMENIVQVTGKRKRSIARGTVRKGTGVVRINRTPIGFINPSVARYKMMEPLIIAGDELAKKVDIDVNVRGGGIVGQASAARIVIAKGLVEFFRNDALKNRFMEYDKSLLVADPRQKETRKPGPSKARGAAQKSKR